MRDNAFKRMQEMEITADALTSIARSGFVEVGIPRDAGWEARLLPWEFLLRASTRNPQLVVVRHLVISDSGEPNLRKPNKVLFVQSDPGKLAESFSFESEKTLVQGSLGLIDEFEERFETIQAPSASELQVKTSVFNPDLIHLAGVDLIQGDQILQFASNRDGEQIFGGMYLTAEKTTAQSGTKNPDPPGTQRVTAEAMSKLLNDQPGRIVSCNLYTSSGLASKMVEYGAAAAVGFQDRVDDVLAERFFASLYQRLKQKEWELLPAFQVSWLGINASERRGAGIVLWTRFSLAPVQISTSKRATVKAESLAISLERYRDFAFDVRPKMEINYCELHNGEGLFERFSFYKFQPKFAHEIHVEVDLCSGLDAFPYRGTFSLAADEPVLDIAQHVNLPLTSDFARSLRDSVLSSLRVRVTYDGHDLYHQTHRIKLLPVNEWRFDREGQSARWLASFVLSQDPAVAEVIRRAQKYLVVLQDDPSAGFDGYQQLESDAISPSLSTHGEQAQESAIDPFVVDTQVRALWAALTLDVTLNYINPPPVFTDKSQRLRTPSDVIDGGRGTCIDLALLFVACLECIDIYPVIFLLADHAFPGYWRSETAHKDFLAMQQVPTVTETGPSTGENQPTTLLQDPGRLAYEEASKLVRDGVLVPIETVCLTDRERQRFDDACRMGLENLRTSAGFEALIDIRRARELQGITPLPVTGEPR